jgi:hypothetical protein
MPFSWVDQLFRQFAQPSKRSASSPRRLAKRRSEMQDRAVLHLENLETRIVPSTRPTPDTYDYIVLKSSAEKPDGGGNPGVGGYTPAQIAQAYGINQVAFNGVKGNGAGTTIAIVDAYSSPTITTDLQTFDKEFGLPNPVFKVVNQTGGSTLPAANAGWAGEITLDVEWSHATAPGANILLVEANSALPSDLNTAVKYAAKQPGVVAVSQSFGGPEYASETAYDTSVFSPTANPDLVFLASSGDTGAPVNYPAISPNVLAVGGTHLTLTATGNYSSESGWGAPGDGSSSGGISQFEKQPAYQKGVVTQSTTMRTNPDVSLDADPETGVDIFQTYGNTTPGSWVVIGGTSDASPQWAGLIAIADQGRALLGEAPLNNTLLTPELYSLPTTTTGPAATADFHDILTGTSLGTPNYTAARGYDLVTGIGTPIVNNLIPTLVGTTPSVFGFNISAPTTADLGLGFDITVSALNANGKKDTTYTGTIDFSSSDTLAGLPDSYTFTSANAGTQTFTVTLNTLGSQTITVTDSSNSSATATASVDVEPGYTFSVSGFPSSVTAGVPGSFTLMALDASGNELTGYSGTVQITSSDPAFQPFNVNVTNGTGTFSATLTTAGVQSLTATDSIDPTMTGSETGILVTPAAAIQLGFIQEPTNENFGSAIGPAVTVAEEDQYGNIITTDSSAQVTLTLGSNPDGALLTGGGTATFTNGVATYSSLSLSALGTGYTLVASSTDLNGTTSASTASTAFNVVYNPLLENFMNGLGLYKEVGVAPREIATTTAAANAPTATDYLGLEDGVNSKGVNVAADGNWYYRTDVAGQVNPGDTVSVWVQFAGAANGRAYFGFGSTSKGTLSVVLAPNTNQLLVQSDTGYNTYTTLAATPLTYSFNKWYLVQVQWGTTGNLLVSLYASDGVTLVKSLTVTTKDTTPGDFAFRAIGSTKYFDTVSVVRGANGVTPVSPITPAIVKPSSLLAPVSSTQSASKGITMVSLPPLQTSPTANLALLQTLQDSVGAAAELKFGQVTDSSTQSIPMAPGDLLFSEGIS